MAWCKHAHPRAREAMVTPANSQTEREITEEAVAWMRSTRCAAAVAVAKFWPDASAADRNRHYARLRKRAQIDRDIGRADALPRTGGGGVPIQPRVASPAMPNSATTDMAPRVTRASPEAVAVASMTRIQFLEWQLAELVEDIAIARDLRDRGMPTGDRPSAVDRRITEVRFALDEARLVAGKGEKLERTPEAVAKAIKDRQALLTLLVSGGKGKDRAL